jgi:hypothetical protein
MTEEWRQAVGWPTYEVSNLGRVRRGELLLRPSLNTRGYPVIGMRNGPLRRSIRVHRLVAEAFLGVSAPGLEVNHIDGRKDNPRLDNLEWVTGVENKKHAWRIGLRGRSDLPIKYGESQWHARLTEQDVVAARARYRGGESIRSIARAYAHDRKSMRRILKGLAWRHVPMLPSPPAAETEER